MKNNFKDTRYTVTVALMMAIIIVLANTPLGMIQLPIIKATTVHIPVIIWTRWSQNPIRQCLKLTGKMAWCIRKSRF